MTGSGAAAFVSGLLAAVWLPPGVADGPPTIAIKAGRIETAAGDPIEGGVVVIAGGRVQAVGKEVAIPEGAEVIDASAGCVVPGFVSPATGLGVSGTGADKPASNPHYRVADELYPFQDVHKRAAAAGFTTLHLVNGAPGIAGQGALVSTRTASPESMLLSDRGPLLINFRSDGDYIAAVKTALEGASKQDSPPPKTAPLKWAIEGEIPTFIACSRPGDISHLVKILEPYKKMRPVLVFTNTEVYLATKELAKAKLPVVVPPGITYERFTRNRLNLPRVLEEGGISFACMTESWPASMDAFRQEMAESVRGGLTRQGAIRAMTSRPAEFLGLDYRLGTIEAGKDANLVVLSGDVFDMQARVLRVLVEGETVYDSAWGGLR